MSANTALAEKYRNNFLKEIEEQVEMGDWVKMCMQCGVCSGSCPTNFQSAWEHPPQELFMMIRAGKREEVLTSDFDVDVHLLLQLHRALPAQAADHPHHARHRRIRAPPRHGAEDAADALLQRPVLEERDQDRPRQRAEAVDGPVLQGWLWRRASRKAWR